jgi:hypothetical protein
MRFTIYVKVRYIQIVFVIIFQNSNSLLESQLIQDLDLHMKSVNFVPGLSNAPMQFNIKSKEINHSIYNNTMLRNGNNSTATITSNKENNITNNDISVIKETVIEEKQINDKFRIEVTSMNVMMMSMLQELRRENEELKNMIYNMMSASTTSNGITTNYDSNDQYINEDSFDNIEMDKVLESITTIYTPSIISSVNQKSNPFYNIL